MLEAEAGSTRGIDFNDAGNAERIGVGASLLRLRRGSGGTFSVMLPVTSIGSRLAGGLIGAGAGAGAGAMRAATVCGAAALRLGAVQNQPPAAINVAATTLISIKPNALRMVTLPLLRQLKFAPASLWERVVNAPPTPSVSRCRTGA